jgi:CubicO group peptidase (beta-lactamase class C family)
MRTQEKLLPRVESRTAAFDAQQLRQVAHLLAAGSAEGLYLGAAYRVVRAGAVIAGGETGLAGEAPDRKVGPDTIFDLASLTKPMATATSILILAERGAFHLDQEAARFLPERAARPLAGITLRNLLTHTSGLPGWRQYHSQGLDRETILQEVQTATRERPIGSRFVYSDLGFMLLGSVVEQVAGESLDRFARQNIFRPLGLRSATYLPPAAWNRRIAATYCPDRDRVLVGEVHDGNCAAMGGVAGHAGLFSTAEEVATYAAMILAGGSLRGVRILGPLAVRQMATSQLPPEVGGSSLGWFMAPNGMLPAGDFLPAGAFGHTGFTGTSLIISPALDLAVVLLTNRVYRRRDPADFLAFRRRFHNAVAAAIGGSSASRGATQTVLSE